MLFFLGRSYRNIIAHLGPFLNVFVLVIRHWSGYEKKCP